MSSSGNEADASAGGEEAPATAVSLDASQDDNDEMTVMR